jgi:hypothetical protein
MAELRVDESSTRRYSHEVCDFRVPKGKCGTIAQSCRSPEINTSHTVAAVRHPPHPPLWLVTLSSLPQPFNTVQLPPQHLTLHRYPPVQPWGTSARNPPTKPTLSSVQAESSAPRGTHHPLPLFPQRYSQTPPADHWEEALAAAAVTPIPGAQPPKPQRCVPTINITEADTGPPSSSPLLLPAKRILPQTVLPANSPNLVLRPYVSVRRNGPKPPPLEPRPAGNYRPTWRRRRSRRGMTCWRRAPRRSSKPEPQMRWRR